MGMVVRLAARNHGGPETAENGPERPPASSRSHRRGNSLGAEFSDAADLRAHSPEFFFDALVAAVDVVNAVDDGFALGVPGELRALEAITHPAIRPRLLAALDAADGTGAPAVVLEAIRLVEGGYVDLLDEVWLIVCTERVQRERLAGRGVVPADATRRIEAQSALVARARPTATRVLDTSGDLAITRAAVDAAWEAALRGPDGTRA